MGRKPFATTGCCALANLAGNSKNESALPLTGSPRKARLKVDGERREPTDAFDGGAARSSSESRRPSLAGVAEPAQRSLSRMRVGTYPAPASMPGWSARTSALVLWVTAWKTRSVMTGLLQRDRALS